MADQQEGVTPGIRDGTREVQAWAALGLLILAITLLVLCYGFTQGSWNVVWFELLFGAGAISVGALLGFLFGIPRTTLQNALVPTVEDGRAPGSSADEGEGRGPLRYQPSTNLEQVSDWLTKILVGAGLVEMKALSGGLIEAGRLAERSFKDVPQGVGLLTQSIILAFLVIGFLATYLWTRIHYARIQAEGDLGILRALNAKVSDLTKRTEINEKRVDLVKRNLSSPASRDGAAAARAGNDDLVASQVSAEVLEKLERFKRQPDEWESDPTADIFGPHHPEENGRRLESTIESKERDGLSITLRVSSTGGPPLIGDVIFVLHPTYPESVVTMKADGNAATLTRYANAAFTVAAIADEGKTVLTYDLSKTPGAPKWFKDG